MQEETVMGDLEIECIINIWIKNLIRSWPFTSCFQRFVYGEPQRWWWLCCR